MTDEVFLLSAISYTIFCYVYVLTLPNLALNRPREP